MLCLNLSNIANVTVTGVDYPCIIQAINKSEAIHLLQNSVFDGIKRKPVKSILKIESTTILKI